MITPQQKKASASLSSTLEAAKKRIGELEGQLQVALGQGKAKESNGSDELAKLKERFSKLRAISIKIRTERDELKKQVIMCVRSPSTADFCL